MSRTCELCAALNSRPAAAKRRHGPSRLRHVLVEDRSFVLCEQHAIAVRAHAPVTIAELRRAFPESDGKRSLLSRRATLDRRAFPARPEGRRASSGRRASDSSA